MPSSRRFCIAAAIALSALVLGALPVAASCEDSPVDCAIGADETTTRTVSLTQISALVDLRTDNEGLSHALYRSLLPAYYDMPLTPVVAVSLTATETPGGPLGDAQGSAVDAAVALKAVLRGEEGWYPLAAPTTSATAVDSGRAAGLPRSLATGSLAASGESWTGQILVGEDEKMALTWTGGDADLPTDAANEEWARRRQPFFGLNPVFTGPGQFRTKQTYRAPVPAGDTGLPVPGVAGLTALPAVVPGTVDLVLDPDVDTYDDASTPLPDLPFGEGESLADIIPATTTVAGVFWQTDAVEVTQTDDLDDGQDGPIPAGPEVCGAIAAGPTASATGFATPVMVMRQGGCATFTNTEEMQHDVTSNDRDPLTRRPLFSSEYTGVRETKPIRGVENLPPGDYPFACSLHGGMTGTLLVR